MDTVIVFAFCWLVAWGLWKWFLRDWINGLAATKSVKAQIAARQIPDEAYYEMAAKEVQGGHVRQGLWTKAWSDSHGDNTKANALYIKLRVAAMKDEAARFMQDTSAGASPKVPSMADKTIVRCPACDARLRVASGKHLAVTCTSCRHQFEVMP